MCVKGTDMEEDEDEDESPESCDITVKFHESKEPKEDEDVPEEVFVQFIRTRGNPVTFSSFMKEMMTEEGGVSIWVADK